MPFKRGGDSSATFPPLLRVRQLPGADDRAVMEVYGWLNACFDQSALHMTDYVVDHATATMFAGETRIEQLVKWCVRNKLITKTKVDGLPAYRLIDDPDFIHIRTRAEVEWERQQTADTRNHQLKVPVLLRDGDNCRYCGIGVVWMGRPGKRTATLDHLDPGAANPSPDRVVVACRSCNSALRDEAGEERQDLQEPPDNPRYSSSSAKYLAANGHQVVADDEQPATTTKRPRKAAAKPAAPGGAPRPRSNSAGGASDIPGEDVPADVTPPTRPRGTSASGATRDPATERAARPDATPPHGGRRDATPHSGRRDTATPPPGGRRDGSTAATQPQERQHPTETRSESTSRGHPQAIGTGSVGSGRVGSGSGSALPNPAGTARSDPAGTRRRRRGSRGGINRGRTP